MASGPSSRQRVLLQALSRVHAQTDRLFDLTLAPGDVPDAGNEMVVWATHMYVGRQNSDVDMTTLRALVKSVASYEPPWGSSMAVLAYWVIRALGCSIGPSSDGVAVSLGCFLFNMSPDQVDLLIHPFSPQRARLRQRKATYREKLDEDHSLSGRLGFCHSPGGVALVAGTRADTSEEDHVRDVLALLSSWPGWSMDRLPKDYELTNSKHLMHLCDAERVLHSSASLKKKVGRANLELIMSHVLICPVCGGPTSNCPKCGRPHLPGVAGIERIFNDAAEGDLVCLVVPDLSSHRGGSP